MGKTTKGARNPICLRGHDKSVTGYDGGNGNTCSECRRQRIKKKPSKEQQRAVHLKYSYGITPAQYDEMYLKQHGKCIICEAFRDRLFVDHNHATDEVRQLLCRNCNASLGLLAENVDSMKRMIEYVERHGAGQERAA